MDQIELIVLVLSPNRLQCLLNTDELHNKTIKLDDNDIYTLSVNNNHTFIIISDTIEPAKLPEILNKQFPNFILNNLFIPDTFNKEYIEILLIYIDITNIFILPCAHEIRSDISSTNTNNCDKDASSLYKEQYYPKCNSSTKINEDMCKIMNKGESKSINWDKYKAFYANGFRSPNYSYSRRKCRETNLIKLALEFLNITNYTIDEINTIPPPPKSNLNQFSNNLSEKTKRNLMVDNKYGGRKKTTRRKKRIN